MTVTESERRAKGVADHARLLLRPADRRGGGDRPLMGALGADEEVSVLVGEAGLTVRAAGKIAHGARFYRARRGAFNRRRALAGRRDAGPRLRDASRFCRPRDRNLAVRSGSNGLSGRQRSRRHSSPRGRREHETGRPQSVDSADGVRFDRRSRSRGRVRVVPRPAEAGSMACELGQPANAPQDLELELYLPRRVLGPTHGHRAAAVAPSRRCGSRTASERCSG